MTLGNILRTFVRLERDGEGHVKEVKGMRLYVAIQKNEGELQ